MSDIQPYVDPYTNLDQWAVTVNPLVILVRFVRIQHDTWYCLSYVMYRKAEKMIKDFVKPIQENIVYTFNMIEEAKQCLLSIPKMIMEAVTSFIRSIADGFILIITSIVIYPINIFVFTVETVTQTMFFPFRMCLIAISSTTKWLWSFVSCHENQERIQQHTWGRQCLLDCLQTTKPIRTRSNTAVKTVQEVCNDIPDGSVSGGFRFVWWLLVWLVSTSMLGVWKAGSQKVTNIKTRLFDKPKEKVRRTYNEIHEYAEDLLGSVYVNVVRLHGEAKIFVESYSQIPTNILVLMIRDRIRTHCQFNKVRQWLRDNVAIPIIIEDNVHRTVSRHTLSSDGSNDDIAVSQRTGYIAMGTRRHGRRRR